MTALLSPSQPYLDIICPHCRMLVFARIDRSKDAPDLHERAITLGATAITLHTRHGCAARRPQ